MKRMLILAVAALFISCGGNTSRQQTEVSAEQPAEASVKTGPQWFYLSENGIHQADNPASIPARTFRPWTEAVRVTDAAIIQGAPVFLINKLGIMAGGAAGSAPALHRDSLLAAATSGGIYRTDTGAGIRLFRNSIFAEGEGPGGEQPCMIEWNPSTGSVSPWLSSLDFGLSKEAQMVALDRIGTRWYASFKTVTSSKVDFDYIEFQQFPQKGAPASAGMRKINQDQYISAITPFSFADAPEQLVSLLEVIPESTGLTVRTYSRSAKAGQTYQRSGEGGSVDASAYVSDDRTAVLFSDGTFYYRPDNTSRKRVILRLPALSSGYVYTSFIITGKSLLASWEEQRFYETGRAGLLETSLPDGV